MCRARLEDMKGVPTFTYCENINIIILALAVKKVTVGNCADTHLRRTACHRLHPQRVAQ